MKRTQSGPRPVVRLIVARGKPEGNCIPVPGPLFTIGRDEACQLRPRNELVSRRHAELSLTTDAVILRDLGSRNRTLGLSQKRLPPGVAGGQFPSERVQSWAASLN
jgi:pSer/pThr/pTyr-binding forkhead associated (FHA) protein